jgi:hypothetical protein
MPPLVYSGDGDFANLKAVLWIPIRIRIRIKVISWIRKWIRIRINLQMTSQNVYE